jgi:hypothetical protein
MNRATDYCCKRIFCIRFDYYCCFFFSSFFAAAFCRECHPAAESNFPRVGGLFLRFLEIELLASSFIIDKTFFFIPRNKKSRFARTDRLASTERVEVNAARVGVARMVASSEMRFSPKKISKENTSGRMYPIENFQRRSQKGKRLHFSVVHTSTVYGVRSTVAVKGPM